MSNLHVIVSYYLQYQVSWELLYLSIPFCVAVFHGYMFYLQYAAPYVRRSL